MDTDDRGPVPHTLPFEAGGGDDCFEPGAAARAPVAVHPVAGVVGGVADTGPGVDGDETARRPEQGALVEVAVDENLLPRAPLQLGRLVDGPLDLLLRSTPPANCVEAFLHQVSKA